MYVPSFEIFFNDISENIEKILSDSLHCEYTCNNKFVKGKFVPVHAMKIYKVSRGMALLILNFVAGWSRVVIITPQSH